LENIIFRFIQYSVLGLFSVISFVSNSWCQDIDFRILKSDQYFYEIEFRLQQLYFEKIKSMDTSGVYENIIIPSFHNSIVQPVRGEPLLSQTGFSLVLAGDEMPQIQIVDYDIEITPLQLSIFSDSLGIEGEIDSSLIRYGGMQKSFEVSFHSFQLKPFRYDTQKRQLTIYKKIVFRISVRNVLPPVLSSQVKSIINREQVLNAEEIIFIPNLVKNKFKKENIKKNWHKKNQDYIKVFTVEDGIYRISYQDLINSGVQVNQINPLTMAMYYFGNLYPIEVYGEQDSRFDETDYIEFYGCRNPGNNQYYNDYSDSCVFWLTWDNSEIKRTSSRSVPPADGDIWNQFYYRLHVEEEVEYYNGDNDIAIFNTDNMPGEGWIWERLYPGEIFTFSVELDDYAGTIWPDSLILKIRGITDDLKNPDHHLQVKINTQTVLDFSFNGVGEVIQFVQIPIGILESGENMISLQSVGDTGAEYDAVYFDWLELSYSRALTIKSDNLIFNTPDQYVHGKDILKLSNFSQNNIVGYDIDKLEKLTDFQIQNENGIFVVLMTDSTNDGTRYIFSDSSSIKEPARLIFDQSSDLKNPNQQADYLIISHIKFWLQANELANYRIQTHGLTTKVVDIEDVMDEFNFGIIDPLAIRSFVKYTVENWQSPAPQFLLLFGDATWDYKKYRVDTINKNFIPAYGNPISDSRLVCIDGENDFLPDLHIGRLPVKTITEAETVVDKIKTYDSEPFSDWQKNIIFLNGGFDEWEQNVFKQQAEELIDSYIESPPFGGDPIRLYLEGRQLIGMNDKIASAINDGALWLSFLGHAGSRTWDLMFNFSDVSSLNNQNKLAFISSMTCHTARFGNPVADSFGEVFVLDEKSGAVSFFGTTGWGYIYQDKVLLNFLFQHIFKNGVRELGSAVTQSKLSFWNLLGFSIINKSTIEQYVLLGDPVQRIQISSKPDFALNKKNISIFPIEPTERDTQLTVNFSVLNYGLVIADSVFIDVGLYSDQSTSPFVYKHIRDVLYTYQTDFSVDLKLSNEVGKMTLSISVDPHHSLEEIYENNNIEEIDFTIYSSSISLSKPPKLSILKDPNLALQVYLPESGLNSERNYYFQIDTVKSFNSPALLESDGIKEKEIVVSWQPQNLFFETDYFWRCRSFYDDKFSKWIYGFFKLSNSLLGWSQNVNPDISFETTNITSENNQLRLLKNPSRFLFMEVHSAGFLNGSFCYLIINDEVLNEWPNRGIHALSFDPLNLQVSSGPFVFDTHADSTEANNLADFIESQPDSNYILLGISDEGFRLLTSRAYEAIESLGSQFIQNLSYRDAWAIIGRKGAASGTVPEMLKKAGEGDVVISDSLKRFYYNSGTIFSPEIGPASSWHNVDWNVQLNQETQYSLKINTYNKMNRKWEIYREISDEKRSLTLNDLDANTYSKLKLELTLFSNDGLNSPTFSGWQVSCDFPPDLTTHPSLFTVNKDSVLEGQPMNVSVPVYNVGMVDSDSVRMSIEMSNNQADWDSITTVVIPQLKMDDSVHYSFVLPTEGYIGERKYRITIDPENLINELSENNNQYTGDIFIQSDSIRPEIKITFDDREILPGELVSENPNILIDMNDNSPLAIDDTSLVSLQLNSKPIYFYNNQDKLEFHSLTANSLEGSKSSIAYRPMLDSGQHLLEVIVKDATQNSTYARVDFSVETEFALRNVLNVPNPFIAETNFTYTLTQPADKVAISVFTIAGRMILKFDDLPGDAGFNYYLWDGHDADGDEIANGVYLYKISAKSGEETVSEISKFIVMK